MVRNQKLKKNKEKSKKTSSQKKNEAQQCSEVIFVEDDYEDEENHCVSITSKDSLNDFIAEDDEYIPLYENGVSDVSSVDDFMC